MPDDDWRRDGWLRPQMHTARALRRPLRMRRRRQWHDLGGRRLGLDVGRLAGDGSGPRPLPRGQKECPGARVTHDAPRLHHDCTARPPEGLGCDMTLFLPYRDLLHTLSSVKREVGPARLLPGPRSDRDA